MSKGVKIVSNEIISDNYYPLRKIKYELKKKDGSIEELTREVYEAANAATVLLYNKEKRTVVLTKQFRIPTYLNNNPTGMLLETCAGIIEDGENPTKSIIREIEEETGYKINNPKKIFELFSTPGCVAELLHYYIAEYRREQKVAEGGGLDEESEDIEVIELPFEDAFIKIANGEIKDAKTVVLLQYAKIYLMEEDKVFEIL
jgi:nudix-type nucleoside diphosphatase (YffH/AdpP family)